jgi:tryptophan synthase alpha chain
MTRLKSLQAKKDAGKKSLVLFITAGDPDPAMTVEMMKAMAESGVDCIELGMPFSDPIADGPVIQRSTVRALKQGITLEDIFSMVQTFRRHHDTPVVLMGYSNPVCRMGIQTFMQRAKTAGVDGLIIADVPYEEGEQWEQCSHSHGLDLIYLLSPLPGTDRTRHIVEASSGYIYLVSRFGITGTDHNGNERDLASVVDSLRPWTHLPVVAGFGISSIESAKQRGRETDGIIIGSWLIRELETCRDLPVTVSRFTTQLRSALGTLQPEPAVFSPSENR